jgi:hypothetical protein
MKIEEPMYLLEEEIDNYRARKEKEEENEKRLKEVGRVMEDIEMCIRETVVISKTVED